MWINDLGIVLSCPLILRTAIPIQTPYLHLATILLSFSITFVSGIYICSARAAVGGQSFPGVIFGEA